MVNWERISTTTFKVLLLALVLLTLLYFLCGGARPLDLAADDSFAPSSIVEDRVHAGYTYYHYCPAPKRSHNTVLKFYKMTGYPHGRAGYVADHVVPLCAGGPDLPSNMQWESREDSLKKDAWERRLCNALREGQERFDQP